MMLVAAAMNWCHEGYTCTRNLAVWEQGLAGSVGGMAAFVLSVILPMTCIAILMDVAPSRTTLYGTAVFGCCSLLIGGVCAVVDSPLTFSDGVTVGLFWPAILGGLGSVALAVFTRTLGAILGRFD